MSSTPYVLRTTDERTGKHEFWSAVGWVPWSSAARRYDGLDAAMTARGCLDTDRLVVLVRLDAQGDRR